MTFLVSILTFVILLWHTNLTSADFGNTTGNDHDEEISRVKRLLYKDKGFHWVKGIVPYEFNANLSQYDRDEIMKSIQLYHEYTPIRFVEYKGKQTFEKHQIKNGGHVLFVPKNKKCQAPVGYRPATMVVACCEMYSCVHELGHVLGFKHEQSSWDRDSWISLKRNRIRDPSQYTKLNKGDFYDVPFDVYSYMLYDPRTDAYNMNFPDLVRYWTRYHFYFFKELCLGYNCEGYKQCNNHRLRCQNDGYVSVVNETCSCVCPEGFDPRYECARPLNPRCGGQITLNKAQPTTTVSFHGNRYADQECHFIVKGDPSQAGNLLLNFDDADIECSDSKVYVAYTRIAHPGRDFCGSKYKRTIQSVYKDMRIKFVSKAGSKSHFKATVTWKPAADLCYADAKGATYSGDVDYTRRYLPCKRWMDVKEQCDYHPFAFGKIFYNLEDNKCRNPDNSFRPWCYIDTITCERQYCDVCGVEQQYDMGGDVLCNDIKKLSTCPRYHNSVTCAKTCNLKNVKDTSKRCAPKSLANSMLEWPRTSYAIGEKAKYSCINDPSSTVEIYCNPDGTWSKGTTACTECPLDWTPFEGKCYYIVEEKMPYDDAVSKCRDLGGMMVAVKNQNIENFLRTVCQAQGRFSYWLGLRNVNKKLQWPDGTPVTYNNWSEYSLQILDYSKDIYGLNIPHRNWLPAEKHRTGGVLCEKKASEQAQCMDFLDNCDFYISHTTCEKSPNLKNLCRRTCGECNRRITCSKDDIPAAYGVRRVGLKDTYDIGETATLPCTPYPHTGTENFVCLNTGQWTRVDSKCQIRCPYPAKSFDGKCYLLVTKPNRSYGSKLDCQARHRDSTLANPKTSSENIFLQRFFHDSLFKRMRVGGYYVYDPRGWQWSNKEYVSWTNWNQRFKGRIDRYNRCMVMLSDGTWEIGTCGEKLPYVCVFDKP